MIFFFATTIISTFIYASGFQLIILHTNDIHERFEQTDVYTQRCEENDAKSGNCYGGVARIAAKVEEIRGQGHNMVVLDAGDMRGGTTWSEIYNGLAGSHFMNQIGYDAVALGNHDFDYGLDGLMPFMKSVKFPLLCSNINTDPDTPFGRVIQSSIVLNVGGETIGVIGYLTSITTNSSIPGPNVIFDDYISTINREVKALEDINVNKIIALGHAGFCMDKVIASAVPGLDVMVGGHSHTLLYNGIPPSIEVPESTYPHIVTQKSGAKVLIVQAGFHSKYLGYLNLTFSDTGVVTAWDGNPILLDNTVVPDPHVQADVNKWAVEVHAKDSEIVGRSRVSLNNSQCGIAECNLGNLIADAYLYKYLGRYTSSEWANVSLAWVQSGDIFASLPQGDITLGDVTAMEIIDFRNWLVLLEMEGRDIRDALELSVATYGKNTKYFPQLSGFQVVFNVTRPVGQRVMSAKVLCTQCTDPRFEPLQDDHVYKLITNRYLATGGEINSTIFLDKKLSMLDYGDTEIDAIVEYLTKFSPVMPIVTNRITVITNSTIDDIG